MALRGEQKQKVIIQFQRAQKDTGSPEVQIALISRRIADLTKHFEGHVKDHSSRLGLLKLVGQRRRLLGYLKKKDHKRYATIIENLGIRK